MNVASSSCSTSSKQLIRAVSWGYGVCPLKEWFVTVSRRWWIVTLGKAKLKSLAGRTTGISQKPISLRRWAKSEGIYAGRPVSPFYMPKSLEIRIAGEISRS